LSLSTTESLETTLASLEVIGELKERIGVRLQYVFGFGSSDILITFTEHFEKRIRTKHEI
jgi:hypothetical protein